MKENEGRVERFYTMVLFAENKFNDDGRPEYYLRTVGQGMSAKCPPGMFEGDPLTVPNDAQLIYDRILEFTN